MKKSVVIVAGGKGLRFGGDMPKQFRLMNNIPVLMHTIDAFYNCDNEFKIVLVIPKEHKNYWQELCLKYNYKTPHTITIGGDTRWQSVKNGLELIEEDSIVGIHDGVRPLISSNLITKTYEKAQSLNAVIPAVNVTDSLRIISPDGKNIAVKRDLYRAVQTPQVFKAKLIKEAYNLPYKEEFTDDASVAENYGVEINIIEGEDSNIKITSSKDLAIAEILKKGG